MTATKDRIAMLERQVATLARQVAGLPVRQGSPPAPPRLRYVRVYDIDTGTDPEDPDDDPFQPVKVKRLSFDGYVGSTTGTLEAAQSDVEIRTVRSGDWHGAYGDGLAYSFEIDGSVAVATASVEDVSGTDTLVVKVHNDSVTWSQIASAVAAAEGGAQFELLAETPGGEFKSADESLSGTFSGGENGSYATYGDEFGIGDGDTQDLVEVDDDVWVIWRSDAKRWELLSDADRLVAADSADKVPGTLDDKLANESTYDAGSHQLVYYEVVPDAVGTPPSNTVRLFTALGGGGDLEGPLRRFEFQASFNKSATSTLVKFLDDDGNMVGDLVMVHDPESQFHGRAAGYVTGEAGFRGVALYRTDLATTDPEADRWEIVECDRLADWAVVEWNESPGNNWTLISDSNNFGGDPWGNRRPVANGGELTIVDPGELLPAVQSDGDRILAILVDPDTSPPTYAVAAAVWFPRNGLANSTSYLVSLSTDGSGNATASVIPPPSGTGEGEWFLKLTRSSGGAYSFSWVDIGDEISDWGDDHGTCLEVVTEIACDDGSLSYDTEAVMVFSTGCTPPE